MSRKRIKVNLPSGETIWLTGDTYDDAFANGLARFGNVQKQTPSKSGTTLRTFVDEVYFPAFIQGLAPTTIDNYNQYLNLNILPFMGDMDLAEINVATVQQFYDWMAHAAERGRKKNLNKKSIERISGLLGKIFRVAVEMKYIDETPIKKTLLRNNGEPAGHHKALSIADVDIVKQGIPSLKDERQRLYMALLVYAGMRPQEVLGLRWECIFFDEGYCSIERTVIYPNKTATIVQERGKTELSIRTVILPEAALQILRHTRKKKGYIIHGRTSEDPASYSTFKRTYTDAFRSLGMNGKYCNYDYRTTYGTELTENGFTSKQVADLMGHADTRMVETVYARRRHEGIMLHKEKLNEMNGKYVS